MLTSHSSHDALNNDLNIEISESHNLLFKLYANLLTNSAIQTGLKQLTRFTQPLLGKFDDSVVKITSNVSRWVSKKNIYNQLAQLWLAGHFPFTGTVQSFEEFAKSFESLPRRQKFESGEIVQSFYSNAQKIWGGLNEPSLEDIKNALLDIVAKTVNKNYGFSNEILATSLYNNIRMLIEKRKEFVSGESFLNLIKTTTGEEFWSLNPQVVKNASGEFYVFAKRFVLIEFPLATNHKDVWKLIVNYVQENSYYYGDSTLSFVEKKIDFILSFLGQKYPKDGEKILSLYEKGQRICKKTLFLSFYPLIKTGEVLSQIPNTKTYKTLDDYLQITDRVKDIIFISRMGYDILRENLIRPTFGLIDFVYNRTKSTVTIILHGISIQALKKNYRKVHENFDILKNVVIIVVGESLHLIFDKESLIELGGTAKKEINRLFVELKNLEGQNLKKIGLEYYSLIKRRANNTLKNAKRAVHYKKEKNPESGTVFQYAPEHDPK